MKITIGSGELAYDEAGSGPAVVLVHAGLADRRMWEPQFAVLAQHYRVFRFDWRGFGESGDAAGPVSRHEDLLGLLDALGLESAALVGCSYGGAHALDAALAAPGRVTALALVCSAISGYEIWTPQMAALAAEKGSSGIPAGRLAAYRDHTAASVDPADVAAMAAANVRLMVVGPYREPGVLDPAVHEQALEMCRGVFRRQWAGPDVTEVEPDRPALGRLAELALPALVVNGTHDLPAVQDMAGVLAAGIPGARRLDLPAGHLPSLETPDALTGALLEFLAATAANRRF
ncbi:MAG TPA: alpha/beta hydrolase [Streptosporangiaceae bacterium]|nr:alpha/beta hydrolase [Streptosporangiaceae bacterium]